jgi:hypothetical protein
MVPKSRFFTPDPNFHASDWWNEEKDGPAGANSRTDFGQNKPGLPNSYPNWLNWALLSAFPLLILSYLVSNGRTDDVLWQQYPIESQEELDSFVRTVMRAKKDGRIPSRHEWSNAKKWEPIDEYDESLVEPTERFRDFVLKKH